MSLLNRIDPSCVSVGSGVRKKSELLGQIAHLAKQSPVLGLHSETAILGALEIRESLGSTGFGEGVAIPHCVFPDLEGFVTGMVTLDPGAEFDSMDGKPVRVAFFIIGPEGERNRHIQLLSSISKLLMDPETVDALASASSADEVLGLITANSAPAAEPASVPDRCLFQVFVQREELFGDILQTVSSEVQGEIAVLESQNAGHYLNRMPLFSAYLGEEDATFSRLILAIVDKSACNDLIRRIYLVSDTVEPKGGVAIAVQELLYSGGSMDF